LAKKPTSADVTTDSNETPEVVVVEQAAPKAGSIMSEQTRLEIEAGRAALAAHAASARAEVGE
jgi:hypothetical protein